MELMADTVQQIKDRLSIVDVVSQYVKLERAGASLRARCPFHAERTPSFHVSPERGTYHCFGCGAGGDIFSFVEAIEGLDFKGALKVLAEKAGVPLVYERSEKRDERERLFEALEVATIFYASRLHDAAKKYLVGRGISDATVREFRIGWAGDSWSALSDHLKEKKFSEKELLDAGLARKSERGTLNDKFRNRIMFPINDSAGRVVGFSGRIFGEHASPEAPKYLNSPETPLFHKSKILYGFDKAKLAIRKLNCAVLVEGQMDLLASHQAGWANTVAVSGTAFTPEHAQLIKRMSDNIVIALDLDEAGIKAAWRTANSAFDAEMNVKVARLPNELDPADFILKEGKEKWTAAIRDAKDIVMFLLDVFAERLPQKDRYLRTVETVILPLLKKERRPIRQEDYIREIARRLDVSEGSVLDQMNRLPNEPIRPEEIRTSAAAKTAAPASRASPGSGRAREAFSILLWQQSLSAPSINLAAYARELEEAIGVEVFAALAALPESERESLRFSAERLHGKSGTLNRDAKTLLSVILKELFAAKLDRATMELKQAERAGDEAAIAVHISVCKLLTTRIAQLHEKV
jgi:DNA primase